jgi:hypothetical protein
MNFTVSYYIIRFKCLIINFIYRMLVSYVKCKMMKAQSLYYFNLHNASGKVAKDIDHAGRISTMEILMRKSKVFAISFLSFFIVFVMVFSQQIAAQTTIASDGFNGSTTLFTRSGGAFYSGNSASGDRPANSPLASEGSGSVGVTYGTLILTTTNNINTTGYTNNQLTFRLAAFGVGSTSDGVDLSDNVVIAISVDGGTNYTTILNLNGAPVESGADNDCNWAYTATAVGTTAYPTYATFTAGSGGGGGTRTTDGYSTLTVTSLPAISTLKVRITLDNNAGTERWVMDDFKITGTLAVPTITNFTPDNGCPNTTSVVITGTNFTGVTSVNFNGVSAAFIVNNSSQITATVPLTAGTGNISVITTAGTATSASIFIVTPLSTAPSSISGTSAICSGSSTLLSAEGGMIAYYPLSGDLNDISGSGLNLSGTGGTFTDGGFNFNGNLYQSASTDILNTDKHTISFYIKYLSAPASWEKIFGYEPSGSDRSPGIWTTYNTPGIHWRYQQNGTVCCSEANSNTGVDYSAGFIYNTWYYVVGIKNGSNFKLFIDGSLVQDITVANPKTTGVSALKFGNSSTIVLKEFKIYNGDLRWYSGNCGGTYVGSGPSITVSLTTSTTYFVLSEGTCNTTSCASQLITVDPLIVATVSGQTNPGCYNGTDGTITIVVTGGTGSFYYSVDNGDNWTPALYNPPPAYVYGGLSANQAYRVRVKDYYGCISE